jgi:predicted nucleotidyltransferase
LKSYDLEAEKIILFGSRAKGKQREDSDWDILLVVKQDINRKTKNELFKEITEKLSHYLIPCDVIIKSIKELEFYKDFYGTATYEALKEGRAL